MAAPNKRIHNDFVKLLMSDFKVETINDGMQEFYLYFHGPNDSPYQGGMWKIRVVLPDDYPSMPPALNFVNEIYHPNICLSTGHICLNVIREDWSPISDLVNVFELFLPQLLLDPDASDPINEDAADAFTQDRALYDLTVREFIEKFAKPETIGETSQENAEVSEDEADDPDDEQAADKADP